MKKALFLAGGWDGHEPHDCANLFDSILQEEGFETEQSVHNRIIFHQGSIPTHDIIINPLM